MKLFFQKGHTPNCTNQIFTMYNLINCNPITYLLKDYRGQELNRCFYYVELLKPKLENVYLFEKVIKRKEIKHSQNGWALMIHTTQGYKISLYSFQHLNIMLDIAKNIPQIQEGEESYPGREGRTGQQIHSYFTLLLSIFRMVTQKYSLKHALEYGKG